MTNRILPHQTGALMASPHGRKTGAIDLPPDPLELAGTMAPLVPFVPEAPVAAPVDERLFDCELVLPQGYEPNYAYPLLIWLTQRAPQAAPDRPKPFAAAPLAATMREVSERNCIGLAISHDGQNLSDRVLAAMGLARKRCHLHTERVYIAGRGQDGTQALALGLEHPGWFAGIVALSAPAPRERCLLRHLPALRGKRVLLGVAADDQPELVAQNRALQKMLWSAGLEVNAVAYDNSGRLPYGFLREIDRFVMKGVARESAVLA